MKKDFLNGDHSFRNWLKIAWGNGYIFVFLLGLAGVIAQLILWEDMSAMIREQFDISTFAGIASTFAMLIPCIMIALVSYKGFYQHWNDLKNGRSR